MTFEGIAMGSGAAIIVYHVMRGISKWRGTDVADATPDGIGGVLPVDDIDDPEEDGYATS